MPPKASSAGSAATTAASIDDLLEALTRYDAALATRAASVKRASDVVELDAWMRTTLRPAVAARKDGALSLEELGKLMDWKLAHGKWRPRLATLVRENSEADVEAATTEAFTLLTVDEDAAKALDRLSKLRGVGPATASAIFALWRPASEPFLSDELVLALGLPKPTYTSAEVKDVRRWVAEAVESNGRWAELGGAEAFERACWAWAVEASAKTTPAPKRASTGGSTARAKRAKKT